MFAPLQVWEYMFVFVFYFASLIIQLCTCLLVVMFASYIMYNLCVYVTVVCTLPVYIILVYLLFYLCNDIILYIL